MIKFFQGFCSDSFGYVCCVFFNPCDFLAREENTEEKIHGILKFAEVAAGGYFHLIFTILRMETAPSCFSNSLASRSLFSTDFSWESEHNSSISHSAAAEEARWEPTRVWLKTWYNWIFSYAFFTLRLIYTSLQNSFLFSSHNFTIFFFCFYSIFRYPSLWTMEWNSQKENFSFSFFRVLYGTWLTSTRMDRFSFPSAATLWFYSIYFCWW